MNLLLLVAALPLAFAGLDQSPGLMILARQESDEFKPPTEGIDYDCAPDDFCGGGDDSPLVCLNRKRGDICCAENCTELLPYIQS